VVLARQLNVARLHSSDQSYHRELAKNVLTVGADSPDVVLTTYDMVKSMNVLTMKLNWRLLVLDEGHLIKNDQTGRAAALRRVRACSTVLLTGTPLQNNLVELWALLSFLNPVFSDSTPFESAFKLGADEHNADKVRAQSQSPLAFTHPHAERRASRTGDGFQN